MTTLSGNTAAITDVDIRLFLRDRPDANKLLDEYEFSVDEIRSALNHAVDVFNGTPPFVKTFTIETWPAAYRYYLLIGAVAGLMGMTSHSRRRNELSYALPGGAANDEAGAADYQKLADSYMMQFRDWIRSLKKEINLAQGWGGR